jgi:dTDP-4-amino-4,6-dideoxygalactose transaminase
MRKLAQEAVGCARPVFLPVHRHLKKDGYPVTDKVWDTSLSIPIYPSLDNREIERIIDGFIGEYSKYNGSANS